MAGEHDALDVPAGESRLARRYSGALVALRWLVVPLWLLIALASVVWRPEVRSDPDDLSGFVPLDSAAVRAEIDSVREFGFPLQARLALVQRDPEGMSTAAQLEAVARAVAVSQGALPDAGLVRGALPVPNAFGLFPTASEQGTTVVTYLFVGDQYTSFEDQTEAAQEFGQRQLRDPDDAYVGVTGSVPARAAQAQIVLDSLRYVELATLAAVVLIVGITFRSVFAPVLALVTTGVAFAVTQALTALASSALGISVPPELRPLLVALLLGVVTDYVIFFLSGFRRQLQEGVPAASAARRAGTEFVPIVVVAGLTVAAGTASLLVARSPLFRAFGPGMALTVLAGLLVSMSFVPAVMALLGRRAFWPGGLDRVEDPRGPRARLQRLAQRRRRRTLRLLSARPVAALVLLVTVAGLVLAALPARSLQLGVGFIPSLPEDHPVQVAADAAAEGFAPGIVSPSVLLVQGEGVAGQLEGLRRLGDLIEDTPEVAAVLGPGDSPLTPEGALLSRSGNAARFLVVFDKDPLGADAIGELRALREGMPALLAQAGLGRVEGVRGEFGGDTAIAATIVSATVADLGRIALAALLVNLLLLVLFLRALVAPLYLLACSVLALAAALGLTTFVFQGLLGSDGLTFYVPFAAAVLLLALGSDYNIFGVGHIWAEARRNSLREAIIEVVPRTTRAITAAGITLAVSFGLLAVVPLRAFRELGFVMFVGILLDAIVVRSLLVPALLAVVGKASAWPSTRLLDEEDMRFRARVRAAWARQPPLGPGRRPGAGGTGRPGLPLPDPPAPGSSAGSPAGGAPSRPAG